MHVYVIIKHARESESSPFLSQVTSLAKDKRLFYQARDILNKAIDYLMQLKTHSGGCGLLKRICWKPPVSDRDKLRFNTMASLKLGFSESH